MLYKNIEIIDNAYGGYGVGVLPDGKKVFVPFAVKSDLLDIEVIEDKKSYSFGTIVNLVKGSEKREKDLYCPHIGVCGGCLFGNIKYSEQINIKKGILHYNFKDIRDFKIDKIFTDAPLRYRIKCNIKFKNKKFGFYKFNSNEFVPVEDCPVISKNIIEYARKLKENLDDFSEIDFIENNENYVLSSLDEEKYINYETIFGEIFVSPTTFFQGNRFLLNDLLKVAVNLVTKKDVLELYCGNGFFTKGLSKRCNHILAVDSDKDAIKLAKRADIRNAKFITHDLNKVLQVGEHFDTFFVDPARVGLSKSVIKMILEKLPFEIVYVSCNPTTLKRDIAKLLEFFKITNFYMFDMFPNTYHIESVVRLELK